MENFILVFVMKATCSQFLCFSGSPLVHIIVQNKAFLDGKNMKFLEGKSNNTVTTSFRIGKMFLKIIKFQNELFCTLTK